MRQKAILIASLLAVASVTFGITPSARCQWVQTSGPAVSSVSCFAVIGTNLFAGTCDFNGGTHGGGVFRSTDDGATWTAVNNGLTDTVVYALAVSGSNLFAGTTGGVFLSTNNGTSWVAASDGLTHPQVLSLLVSGATVLAGTFGGGVFRSTNNGSSWSEANSGIADTNVKSLGIVGANLLAGTYTLNSSAGSIYLSTDDGMTWANLGFPGAFVYSFAVSGTKLFAGCRDGVYLSTDTGQSWSLPLTSSIIQALAVSGTKLFAGTFGGGVLLSTDDGSNWTPMNTGFTANPDVARIRALAVKGTNLFAGNYSAGNGVWRRPLSEFDPPSGPLQGSWSTAASSGFTPRFIAASSVVGGKIHVIGGYGEGGTLPNTLQVFDPATNSWSTPITSGTFTPRAGLSSAEVNGKIYVMGGGIGSWGAPKEVNVLEVFDPSTNTWTTPTTTGAFTARILFTSAAVYGKIYVFGGADGALSYFDNVEVYDPSRNEWSKPGVSGTFSPRDGLTSCVIDNKIYAFGGRYNTAIVNTLEVFDPATNAWSTPVTSGTASARRGATSSVIGGKMIVFGGADAGGGLNTVEIFDPATNAWTTPTTNGNLSPRYGPTSAVMGDKCYVMGGSLNQSSVVFNTNEVLTLASSGVHANEASRKFELFPNPTNGFVTVHSASATAQHVTITNMLGVSVMELSEPPASDFSLDLSKLPAGTYFVRIAGDGSTTTRMIVRE